VEYDLGALDSEGERARIADAAPYEPRSGGRTDEVGLKSVAEIIEDRHYGPLAHKAVHEVAPDETGPASNKHSLS
jgi:hypothetical protein